MGIEMAGVTLDIGTTVADALNVPLRIMVAPCYEQQLQAELAPLEREQPIETTRLEGNIVQDVSDEAGPQDLILVTTRGTKMRFRASLGHIPEGIIATTSDSIMVIHYP